MRLKKSVIIYLFIVTLVLTIGALAYRQIVREQTPVNPDQINNDSHGSTDATPQTIEQQPLVIDDKVKF